MKKLLLILGFLSFAPIAFAQNSTHTDSFYTRQLATLKGGLQSLGAGIMLKNGTSAHPRIEQAGNVIFGSACMSAGIVYGIGSQIAE